MTLSETLRGLGISPGRAAGRVYRRAAPRLPDPAPVTDTATGITLAARGWRRP